MIVKYPMVHSSPSNHRKCYVHSDIHDFVSKFILETSQVTIILDQVVKLGLGQ